MERIGPIALLAIALAACTIRATCELTNSSGDEIVLRHVSEGAAREIGKVSSGSSVLVRQVSAWGMLEVVAGSKAYRYRLEEPAGDCVEFVGWGPWSKRVFRAELRKDLQLWVTCPTGVIPVPPAPDRA